MRYVVFILILVVTTGCPAYDPPVKGNDIFIRNQTADFVYVLDSLPATGSLPLYDTFLINNKPVIETKPNYLSKWSSWDYFFDERQHRLLTQNGVDSLLFYFIPPQYIDSTCEQIRAGRHYRLVTLSVDDAWKKPMNHIFYYRDTIEITHHYEVGRWPPKQAAP